MLPLVSIYIPTHNRPEFLERALSSLVQQTYRRLEVLVCDDGSQQDLSHVQERFHGKFYNMVWLRNDSPRGACFSRNRLINIASGDYITGLDDDDEFYPDRLQSFIDSPQLNRYAYLCSTNIISRRRLEYKGSRYKGEVSLRKLTHSNLVGNQVFTKTEQLRSIGGFDEVFPAWQDYDVWIRLTHAFGAGYKLAHPTYKLNIDHELNRITDSPKARLGYSMFIEKHKDLLSESALKSLFFMDAINRRANLSFGEVLRNYPNNDPSLVLKYLIKRFLI